MTSAVGRILSPGPAWIVHSEQLSDRLVVLTVRRDARGRGGFGWLPYAVRRPGMFRAAAAPRSVRPAGLGAGRPEAFLGAQSAALADELRAHYVHAIT